MNTKMRKNQSRKGVTLLFTISMIVLFLLMGTTFVVVANDYFKTANRRGRLNTYSIDTISLMDRAFYDVLRGPDLDDTSAALRTHSILEDQYGYGHKTIVDSVATGAINGLQVITIDPTTNPLVEIHDPTSTFDLVADHPDGFFGGCVLTFTTGPAAGYSSRIVSSYFEGTAGSPLLIVIPTDSAGIDWSTVAFSEIIINGRDFAGDGAGNIMGTADLDTAGGTARIGDGILTPNRKGQSRTEIIAGGGGVLPYSPLPASVNEPYDAADENNWFLSGVDAAGDLIPSFHRDRHYEFCLGSIGRSPSDIRSFSFRPVYLDGESSSSAQVSDSASGTSRFGEFHEEDDTSGALAFRAGDLVNAVNDSDGLDVDSDGDGAEDAVWIDIGLPVQTDDQGRQFKPLVAYYIVDMDGRLNVNAHGSYADEELGTIARRGGSFGVAEVSLSGVTSDYIGLLNERSGADNIAGNASNSLSELQTLYGYNVENTNFNLNTGDLNLFASGADIFGKNVVGRNVSPGTYGEDALQGFTTISTLSASTQPIAYAADLGVGGGVGDSLYQSYEMEALLREDDFSSALQFSRLRDEVAGLSSNKDLITTDSAEIAVPPVSYLSLLWGATGNSRTIYRELVSRGVVSEEMLMGGLFDLNQPTGNGIDDDGDGTIDEPTELLSVQQSAQRDNPIFDLDNAGDRATGDDLARQRKARQLYTLALLASGNTAPTFAGFASDVDYRTAVAQWAVNIVDFIDSDSIMTAFEYDADPFNAIYVDGNPTSDDAGADDLIVFGAERPELLINETFTSHDRRNQDTGSDNGDNDDVAGNDNDWDSTHYPTSNVLIELYNPWTQLDAINAVRLGATPSDANQVPPAELYAEQTRGSDRYYGVDLSRTVANTGSGETPVWRIGVKREETDATFLRAIFMADPSTAEIEALVAGDNFFPAYRTPGGAAVTPNVVEPGGYHVLGSSGNVNTPNEFRMTFGRLTGNVPDVPNTRSIALDNSTGANMLSINDPTGTLDGSTISCGIAVIDRFLTSDGSTITATAAPRSLSLSDPNGGYGPLVAAQAVPVIPTDEADGILFTPAIDTPLDAQVGGGRNNVDLTMIWNNGVSDSFRVIYLQRLADPTQPFNETYNPYITIDKAEVDLVAFNGLNSDANNDDMLESGEIDITNNRPTTSSFTALTSSERGENRANIGVARDSDYVSAARRTFFKSADAPSAFVNANTGLNSGADSHNFSFSFDDSGVELISFGERNESVGGFAGSSEPLGDLVWLNRPLANPMELVHVPIVGNGGVDATDMPTLLDFFNRCREIDDTPALTATSTPQEIFAYYFGDDKFGHLMGFGGMAPVPAGAGAMNFTRPPTAMPTRIASDDPNFLGNRFDVILDYVSVPSKFQGLRTWLDYNQTEMFDATPTAPVDGMIFNLRAPFNSLPSFRDPGKINLNSMPLTSSEVFDSVEGGFGSISKTADHTALRSERNTTTSLSDIGGRFLPASRGRFVHETPRTNAEAGLFRRDPGSLDERLFDIESTAPENDTDISSWYENEFRQKLGSIATTRSSVFSIWITVGYFEVDQYGRIGRELGSDEGQIQRNRAFYMVDRSIPVASEPGKNHNVDQAVLVRTIIE